MHIPARCWLAAMALFTLDAARGADAPPPASAAKTPPRRTLDLKPPSINKLYTPEQIKRLLSTTVDPDLEGVEVESSREKLIDEKTPLLRSAPAWLPPRTDDDKRARKPDATSPHARPPAAPPPGMAGEPRRYDR